MDSDSEPSDSEPESGSEEEEENPEEEEEQAEEEDHEPGQRQTHSVQVHASATRVSTQPRSKIGSNERVIIDPHSQTTLVVKEKEADKLLIHFPNLKHTTDEETIGWNWTKKTQPVMVNGKTPGLITKWRAPFEKGCKGSKRRLGKITLTISNPTEKKFRLPKSLKITNMSKRK